MATTNDTIEALQKENAALRLHIATLEQALPHSQQEPTPHITPDNLIQAIIDAIPYAIYWKDTNLIYRGCNRKFATDLGMTTVSNIVGKTDADLPWHPNEAEQFRTIDQRIIATNEPAYDEETIVHTDGTQEWFETYKLPLRDTRNIVIGVLGTYNNITERKRSEELARQTVRQQTIIDAQQATLRELSTPLVPIMEGVVAMPIVGTIDSLRAQRLMETLLEGISTQQADVAILDITGVRFVDTQVSNALIRTAQAAQLLGAHVVLTGVQPEVAQTIVQLGNSLEHITTRSNLQGGITYAIEHKARSEG